MIGTYEKIMIFYQNFSVVGGKLITIKLFSQEIAQNITLINLYFICRYEKGCSRNFPQHPTWKTSHDVLGNIKQRNSSDLQEVHARCNNSHSNNYLITLRALRGVFEWKLKTSFGSDAAAKISEIIKAHSNTIDRNTSILSRF